MEQFAIKLAAVAADAARETVLCGVVSSGNLEILMQKGDDPAVCSIEVNTSAHGFREIWEAVLADFVAAHPVGGTCIAINDAGATPAVVSLRLAQAFEDCRGVEK